MASVQAHFVAEGAGESAYNPTVTVHGRMYYGTGALNPPAVLKHGFASVCIHDTEHAAMNRKHFYGQLREPLLQKISAMLEKSNEPMKSFVSLRDLMMKGMISESVQLLIHAHSKINPGHERKHNVPEASEVATLIVGEHLGKLDIILRSNETLNKKGGEQLQLIHLGSRMYDPPAYPLLFLTKPKDGISCFSTRIRKGSH